MASLFTKGPDIIRKIVPTAIQDRIRWIVDEPKAFPFFLGLVVVIEIIWGVFLINIESYHGVDFHTYMDQVALYRKGQHDYEYITGPQGPLVYPGLHVYIFNLAYTLTDGGQRSLLAQYLWILPNIALFVSVACIYHKAGLKPRSTFFLLFMSKKIQSIAVLNMFNDPFAALFGTLTILSFQCDFWKLGCVMLSLGVGVKMGILLFAPAVLFLLILKFQNFWEVILHLAICGIVQLLIGLPFLLKNPISYITIAFNFGRSFDMSESVNWQMISNNVFTSKKFHTVLLILHVSLVALFLLKKAARVVTPHNIAYVMYVTFFIGMAFARSLHVQFYCWVYFSLPFLMTVTTNLTWYEKLVVLLTQEMGWDCTPRNITTSFLVFIFHVYLLDKIFTKKEKKETKDDKLDKGDTELLYKARKPSA